MSDLTIGYDTLGADINKTKNSDKKETTEGVASEKLPELTLEMPDADIIKLTKKWNKDWTESPSKTEWDKHIEENEKYWLGKQFDGPIGKDQRARIDNLIFESLETYLPQMTRRNPEPLVQLDPQETADPVKDAFIQKVKLQLADLADKNKLRLKLKKGGRFWAIYLLAVAKYGWDMDKNLPTVRMIRPKKIILDPDATIDEDGYTGNRIGEYRKMEAESILRLIEKDPTSTEAVRVIKEKVGDDVGTEIQFIEWWTPQYFCWVMNETVLLKKRNPHWNYDKTEENSTVDDYGNEAQGQPQEVEGVNHFPVPDMPYSFLSVFNLGDQPMDKTSLIGQNLSNQDAINKRNKQIDKNTDRMNGGMVVSLERSGLTESQAKGVTAAIRNGGVVVIPAGAPRDAIDTYNPVGLPADVFNDLADKRNRMRDIFGTRGSSAAGLETENTVRGKFMNRTLDTDRIGGGVSEYLEQLADDIYNWWVQMLYVYDPNFTFIAGGKPPKISVSVKEGSLLPKDSATIAAQAVELATAGKMSTLDMYKKLEYANAEEMAANAWLEMNAPQILYSNDPRVAQAVQMQAQAAQQQADAEAEKEMQKMQMQHQMDIQKEEIKVRGGVAQAAAKSALSQKPKSAAK